MVELSSLDVLFLARELGRLEDAFIDRVYEIEPGLFLFRTRHGQRGRASLLIRPGAYACLVDEAPETPQAPTSFATLLRKHLPGARIRRVDQHEFDRILLLHLDLHGEPRRLVVELFGKGNLVLVGPDDKIQLAQRTETFRDRTVRRGEVFRFPPARINPVKLSQPDFERIVDRSDRDAVRFLALDLGFGGDLAEELLHRAKVAKDRKASGLTDSEKSAIWAAWQSILHAKAEPATLASDGSVRVESIALLGGKHGAWTRTPQPSLSAAIDRARVATDAARPPPPDEQRERIERQIQNQEAGLEALRAEADAWTMRANRLYERFGEAQAAHGLARELVSDGDWAKAGQVAQKGRLPPGIVKVLPESRRVVVGIGGDEYALDPSVSLERNASQLFDEAKKVRAKIGSGERALEEARHKLATHVKSAVKPAAGPKARAPERRFWFESYRWFYTTEGFLVIGGRDAPSNEKVVKKHMSTGDLYFHADVHGAASCVLKSEGRVPGEASLRQAAQFAAAFSKAFAQFGSADAYWVRPEQVSKTAPSGEYVSRGAFVIRGERTYVPHLPMVVAVGPVRLDKEGRPSPDGSWTRLMGGPPEAVGHWSPSPLRVGRGDRKPADVVREIAQRFGTSHEEVQAVLPAGTLRIAQEGGA